MAAGGVKPRPTTASRGGGDLVIIAAGGDLVTHSPIHLHHGGAEVRVPIDLQAQLIGLPAPCILALMACAVSSAGGPAPARAPPREAERKDACCTDIIGSAA